MKIAWNCLDQTAIVPIDAVAHTIYSLCLSNIVMWNNYAEIYLQRRH